LIFTLLNTPHGLAKPYYLEIGIGSDVVNLHFNHIAVNQGSIGQWIQHYLQDWIKKINGEEECRVNGEPFLACYKINNGTLHVILIPHLTDLNSRIDNFACLLATENGDILYYHNERFPNLPVPANSTSWFLQPMEQVFNGVTELGTLISVCQSVIANDEILIRQPVDCSFQKKCTLDTFPVVQDNLRYRFFALQNHASTEELGLQLNVQEKKFNRIIDNFNLGLLEVDDNGRIMKANSSFCKMSGYTMSELLGRDAGELLLNDENRELMKNINSRRQEGYSDAYELNIRTKKGELKWWIISGAPNLDEAGNERGSIGIHWDITKQKELENNLTRDKNRAEALAEFKTQFLANMSHEIRTPLNAIVGMIRELKVIATTPDQKDFINIADIASEALLNIINDVLDYSKLEAGKLSLESIPFHPTEVAKNAVLLISDRIREKKLEFEFHCHTAENETFVGDPNRIQQCLLNILSNASKFTPLGKIELTLSTQPLINETTEMELVIQDTGVGMDPNFLNRVFDKFSQADETISRKYGGSGLGLSITKSLIEMMGGTVHINSQKHIGTTVTIKIPLRPSSSTLRTAKTDYSDYQKEITDMSVLVVEDNALNRAVARAFLTRFNIIVTEAVDGLQALEIVDKRNFDLILMDIQMPTIDGIEVCNIIRSKKITTPIVALTANAQQSEKIKCEKAGMNDYLIKPFKEEEILSVLAKYGKKESVVVANFNANSTHSLNKKLFQLDRIKDLVGDEIEIVNSIVQLFVREGKKIADTLEYGINNNDISIIRAKLHELRPNLHNMGMDETLALLEDFRAHIIDDNMTANAPQIGISMVNHMREGIEQMSKYLDEQ
jgi:PAS domain S-box-containing protein